MFLSGTHRLKSLIKPLRKMDLMLCSKLETDHGIMFRGVKAGCNCMEAMTETIELHMKSL